ncbi:MAG: rhomboid family intramembrane serine protease [Flavobacteriaceae bacterium]|nr:rhomboid family intramembrane serine protease [Flavobacteriaceae bacterium]|tara:strand:+ start:5995 stop:6873 length:879 start_codon:yes stop_codon:yes gene_type:complete
MNFREKLFFRFQQFNVAEKLIAFNVIFFVLPLLVNTFLFLFKIPIDSYTVWFELSSSFSELVFKPWTLISYSFLHSGFFHLFFNMYIFLFTSRLFLNLFKSNSLLNVYFLGVIFGGLLFLFSYNFFPAFENSKPYMIGSSAGVMSLLIFMSTYSPNLEVRLIIFNVKLLYIGIAFMMLDVIQIPYGNAGGHIAHLGGALLGFFYANKLKNGVDIGLPFERIIFKLFNLFQFNKTKMNVAYKNKSSKKFSGRNYNNSKTHQKKIDEILDKISSSGYESLSKKEKDFLFKAGNK